MLYLKWFLIYRTLLGLANLVHLYGFVIGVFRPFIPVYLLNCLLVGSVFSFFLHTFDSFFVLIVWMNPSDRIFILMIFVFRISI